MCFYFSELRSFRNKRGTRLQRMQTGTPINSCAPTFQATFDKSALESWHLYHFLQVYIIFICSLNLNQRNAKRSKMSSSVLTYSLNLNQLEFSINSISD